MSAAPAHRDLPGPDAGPDGDASSGDVRGRGSRGGGHTSGGRHADLSGAFGAAAVTSLRGLLPRRGSSGEPDAEPARRRGTGRDDTAGPPALTVAEDDRDELDEDEFEDEEPAEDEFEDEEPDADEEPADDELDEEELDDGFVAGDDEPADEHDADRQCRTEHDEPVGERTGRDPGRMPTADPSGRRTTDRARPDVHAGRPSGRTSTQAPAAASSTGRRPAVGTRPAAPATPAARTTPATRATPVERAGPDTGRGTGARAAPGRRVAADVPTGGRRWGRTRVTSPDHVDLLVLSTLREGPGDVAIVIDRLRRASGGVLVAPDNAVARALHRLARGGQVQRVTTTANRPAYRLTAVGGRVADGRAKQWAVYARAVDAVVTPPRRP